MTNATLPTPPKARTKRQTAAPVATRETLSDAPQAPEITSTDNETLDLDAMSADELATFSAAMTAQSEAMTAQLAARLRAIEAEKAEIVEKAANIKAAGDLLNAKSRNQRQQEAQVAIATERATQEAAYDDDRRTLAALLATIQAQTAVLCEAIKEAGVVESRLHMASRTLGRDPGPARAIRNRIEGYTFHMLNGAGLNGFPRARGTDTDRIANRYGSPDSDGGR